MGAQSSKVVTDKEAVTSQYIENCKSEVNSWHNFTEKVVKDAFEESLSLAGVSKNDGNGIIKRILEILRRLRCFISSGFGTFFDALLGCCSENKTPGEMADAQFAELYKDMKDFEQTYRDVLNRLVKKLGEQGGAIFSFVVTAIVAFFRGIINWIKWFFQKIGEVVESCVDFVTNATRSLFEKTGELENDVRAIATPISIVN